MSWVSSWTRQYKRDAAPSLLEGCSVSQVVGELSVSLLLPLFHQMTVSSWMEWEIKKKLIVVV